MENINRLLSNPKYKEYLRKLGELEKDRWFCGHDLAHFLDVARIAYITVMEERLNFKKEVIYAIALLHDIGRVSEYTEGKDHHKASVEIAKELLGETNFIIEDKEDILRAIDNHRKETDDELSKLIYNSDKLSRNCFNCRAYKECYWKEEKKNKTIKL